MMMVIGHEYDQNSDQNHGNPNIDQEHCLCDNYKVSVRSTVRVILRPIMSCLPFIGGVEVPDF